MKQSRLLISILYVTFVASSAIAANGHSGENIPLTQEVSDQVCDPSTNSCVTMSIQNDGLGFYVNDVTTYKGKTSGTQSYLQVNVCDSKNLPNGDRLLDTA